MAWPRRDCQNPRLSLSQIRLQACYIGEIHSVKILWVNTNFMHPTTKGGQIRTLEMLRRLHRRHEIHYVAIENPAYPEGPKRSGEYSTRSYPYRFEIASKTSAAFYWQLAAGLFA